MVHRNRDPPVRTRPGGFSLRAVVVVISHHCEVSVRQGTCSPGGLSKIVARRAMLPHSLGLSQNAESPGRGFQGDSMWML